MHLFGSLVQKHNEVPIFKHFKNFSKISKDIPAQDPEENCNKALLWEETEEFKVNSHGRGSSQILDLKHRVWNNFYYAELPCVLCPDISTMLQKIQGHV